MNDSTSSKARMRVSLNFDFIDIFFGLGFFHKQSNLGAIREFLRFFRLFMAFFML